MKKYSWFLIACLLPESIATWAGTPEQFIKALKSSAPVVYTADGSIAPDYIKVIRNWNNDQCEIRIVNTGRAPLKLKEVMTGIAGGILPPTTPFYAEGFQMLTQTAGTLAHPETLGNYTDAGHYKISQPEGYLAVYNLLRLYPANGDQLLLGYTS
ncbi:hypothetical protein, partial [Chitinophaga sp.]|uniref:hypothetical protein n=1 Tax=Chitinophaga sp. TaxID=1869181 RepID=UPI002F93758F